VVAFHGAFIAIGTIWTSCCDDSHPWLNRGVAWTSPDGRAWTLRSPIPDFKHASLDDLVTDGTRLIAVGSYAPPVRSGLGVHIPAVWVSTDGIRWVRASGTIPSFVAVGAHGFIGAAVKTDSSSSATSAQFVTSTNGLKWTAVSNRFAADLRGLAAARDGSAIAVGVEPRTPPLGDSTGADMMTWRSTDGTRWSGPETTGNGGLPVAVTSDGRDFLAVVDRDVDLPSGTTSTTSEVWRLAEGQASRPASIPLAEEDYLDSVFVIGDALIATGATLVNDAYNAMVWISTDGGTTWGRLEDPQAFSDINNGIAGIVPTPSGLLAVGNHWDSTTMHAVPSFWLAAR